MTPTKDTEALRRELVGWYLYDFANSAFFQSAMTVRARSTRLGSFDIAALAEADIRFSRFLGARRSRPLHPSRRNAQVFVPLLVDDMANTFAWSRHSTARPESCASFEDDAVKTNCVQCVEGDGDQIRFVDPVSGAVTYADLPSPELPGGINPTSFIFTMISISVLFQAILFITFGSLGDYGNYRRRGLVLASTVGACACCLFVVLPSSASLYWLGGLLIMVSNVSLGVSVVFYNSYLPLMVEDSALVVGALKGRDEGMFGDDEVYKAREAANSEYSSKGQMWGYIGGTTCLILSVFAVYVCTLVGASDWWAFGIAASLSGFWWLAFSAPAFARLPERPGPPAPKDVNLLLQGWLRTGRLLRHLHAVSPNTNAFLLLFFVFSDGYATIATVSVLFASRELCMGALELSALAVIVPLFAAVGGHAWHAVQVKTGWSSKRVLVLNLLFLAALPLWGCVGFFTTAFGLRKPVELYVLAVWFGSCLGSAQAFGRAVFSELIPKGHEADMFALFEITDKGSSWMGPLIAASVVQTTGKVRPVLIYLLCAMVLPGGLLHGLDLEPSIKAAKGDAALAVDGAEDAEDAS